jgi:dinuclear metal center YbgI/SA1388 family protein
MCPARKAGLFFTVCMTIHDIQHIMEVWAPKEIAWENDNIGLQVGALKKKINKILVTLSVSDNVVLEAKRMQADLIISHHPLIYRPISAISDSERTGRLISMLIRHNIALYCAHTNLDFTRDGVSFSLARALGLNSIDFLRKEKSLTRKIVVYVPQTHIERVRHAMSAAGAGIIGNYESCSFSNPGIGSFKPIGSAKPFIGSIGNLETVDEIRLEMNVPEWRLKSVIDSMRIAHPYEEVAYDVYPILNTTADCGEGAIGELMKPQKVELFLKNVKRILRTPILRTSGRSGRTIRRVACCGGGGSSLIQAAINRGADIYITGDVSFHRFEDVDNRILLVDAGHYETEYPVLRTIVQRLRTEIKRRSSITTVAQSKTFDNNINYRI